MFLHTAEGGGDTYLHMIGRSTETRGLSAFREVFCSFDTVIMPMEDVVKLLHEYSLKKKRHTGLSEVVVPMAIS